MNGNGIPGIGTIDGPFVGFHGNFDVMPVPIPAAVWLFGSGLIGLASMVRRKKYIDM